MAVTCYVGEPGSGKTYEVVTEVILPALRTGRRVVSNVRGLNYDEMRAYLQVDCSIPPEQIGSLVVVDTEQPGKESFWYTEKQREAVVQPGDLVVLDEVWRWCGKGETIHRPTYEFFRMHRQYVNDKGTSTDVVLISQSIQDLDRKVLVVVEKHFRMEKYKTLGSKKQYSVEAFNGYKTSNNARIRLIVRRYDKRFYCMYQSYAGKGGDEREVDGRLSIWRSPLILVGMPLGAALIVFSVWQMTSFFTREEVKPVKTASGASSKAAAKSPVKGAVASPAAFEPPPRPPLPDLAEWRVVGLVQRGGRMVVVVEQGGRYRFLENPPDVVIGGVDVKVGVDGRAAAGWTGGAVRGASAAPSVLPGSSAARGTSKR